MDVRSFIESLRSDPDYRDQIVRCRVIPARPPRFAEPRISIDPRLREALAHDGIDRLYTHQAAALDVASRTVSSRVTPPTGPADLVVVTGTASGKTLCYNLPVINTLLADPDARALYLFPTKALAQDQLASLQRLLDPAGPLDGRIKSATYDGDTPASTRRTARRHARIILSNPDMLHATILPQHPRWARERFFPNLKFVVIDELHAYRGTFGSHVAGVLRRLRRICNHYDADPTFIASSATIANPGDHAAALIGRPVTVIDDDGSPRGRKYFLLWNPPFLDAADLERRSANIEAQRLMKHLITHGAQTITFARARVVAELIHKYLREDLLHTHPELADRIRAYRGGYLADQRRDIERRLFTGRLLGVCSTNALELGIDVGTLDAAVITGFPGTICSLHQQAGRAGRSKDESLAVFIAYNDPIDQYFMRHPDYLFAQSPEHAAIDPRNDRILESQLQCAARELPVAPDDAPLFGCDVIARCRTYLHRTTTSPEPPPTPHPAPTPASAPAPSSSPSPSTTPHIWNEWPDGRFDYHRADARLPHHCVSLRLISNETFDIIDVTAGRTDSIGQVDFISAPELVYPRAVYIHEGRTYLVRDLDFDARVARVERTDVDYYTQVVLSDHCRIVETLESADALDPPSPNPHAHAPAPGGTPSAEHAVGRKHFGTLDVTWQSVAFKKIKYYTLEVIGQDALDLPPQTIHTTGLWAAFPQQLRSDLSAAGHKPIEAVVGVRNLLLATLPMLAMCDRRDISGCVHSAGPAPPAMFVYDRYDGGLGYARLGYDHFGELLRACHTIVTDCPCQDGCPSCVALANVRPPLHSDPDVGPAHAAPDKAATRFALDRWLA